MGSRRVACRVPPNQQECSGRGFLGAQRVCTNRRGRRHQAIPRERRCDGTTAPPVHTSMRGDVMASDLDGRLRGVLATMLHIPETEITAALSSETLEKWDSIAHMNIMLALEDAFG